MNHSCADYQRRLADVIAVAKRECGSLSEMQINWRPDEGAWSVGEVLQHVLETTSSYLDQAEPKIEQAKAAGLRSPGPFGYGWFTRWFVGMVEPPPKRALPAPKRFQPESRHVGPDIVDRYLASGERLQAAIRAAEGLDLQRIKVASPVSNLLRFELGAVFWLMTAHMDRHHGQIDRLLRSNDFPKETAQ